MTFLTAIIFTSLGVTVTSEINIVDKKWKWFQFGKCCSHYSDVRLKSYVLGDVEDTQGRKILL